MTKIENGFYTGKTILRACTFMKHCEKLCLQVKRD